MRVLALDVGQKRIGVALCDPDGLLAFPLATIDRTAEFEDIDAILGLASKNEVGAILVGLPVSLSGRLGPQARQVVRFTKVLSARAEVTVSTLDERYSTVEAERLMREAGARPSKARARVDAAAAAVILQSYLDSVKGARR